MDTARFRDWIDHNTAEMISFGIPEEDAQELMGFAERVAHHCEQKAREDRQFLSQYKTHGSKALAERYGMSPRAIRLRRKKIIEAMSESTIESA